MPIKNGKQQQKEKCTESQKMHKCPPSAISQNRPKTVVVHCLFLVLIKYIDMCILREERNEKEESELCSLPRSRNPI